MACFTVHEQHAGLRATKVDNQLHDKFEGIRITHLLRQLRNLRMTDAVPTDVITAINYSVNCLASMQQ
jgi:hypothetical protein